MNSKPTSTYYGGGGDHIDQMPEAPNRGTHHRRTQSETFFRFPAEEDDTLLLLDDVVADFNFASIDLPSFSGDAPVPTTTQDSDFNSSDVKSPARKPAHLRSLSVGSEFFDGNAATTSFEGDFVLMMLDNSKKPLPPDKLAQLSLIDPKRAKRILANRQSAARSKERKTKYTNELERKVQTLQAEATTLSTQVTKLQRDTSGLTSENKELKLRLEAMEQHAHLRDALNEALREEVNRLKLEAGQVPLFKGVNFNMPLPPQIPNSNTIGWLKPTFMDFN